MPAEDVFNKESIDSCLAAFAEECKLFENIIKPVKIIIVGGASVLLNYSFRLSTRDVDIYSPSFKQLGQAIKNIAKKFNLNSDWLNDDFKQTKSFSDNLGNVSVFYKNIDNVLEVNTVSEEYLIAMKLMSLRPNRSDLSDVAGIFWEKSKKGSAFLKSNIEYAIKELYGSTKDLSEDSLMFFNNLFNVKDYEKLYNLYVRKEHATKKKLSEVKKKDLFNTESTNFQNNVRIAKDIVNNIYNKAEQSLIEEKVITKPDNEKKHEERNINIQINTNLDAFLNSNNINNDPKQISECLYTSMVNTQKMFEKVISENYPKEQIEYSKGYNNILSKACDNIYNFFKNGENNKNYLEMFKLMQKEYIKMELDLRNIPAGDFNDGMYKSALTLSNSIRKTIKIIEDYDNSPPPPPSPPPPGNDIETKKKNGNQKRPR